MALFVIAVYNSLEKLTKIENNHCVFVCLFNAVVGSFPVEVKFSGNFSIVQVVLEI